jgi:acyl-CoA dehydrogenase
MSDQSSVLRRQVRELTARWAAEGRYVPRCDNWLRGFDPAFSKELARLGLIGLTWPTAYGGAGRSNLERLSVTEELLRAGAPVAAHWVADRQIGPAVLRHGTERLRHEILPGIVSADYIFCLGMSEPEAGSDLAAVRTTASRASDGWRLRGHKIWTSGAHRATHMYVLARTDQAELRHDGLSEFVIDMNAPGITVTPILDMSGEHHFNEVMLDDVPVPGHRLLGERGNGWRQVVEQLSFERGGPERLLSSYPLLAEVLALRAEIPVALHVELGILLARLAGLRALCREVAAAVDAGEAPVDSAAALKYLGNAFETDIVDFAREAGLPSQSGSSFAQALLSSPGYGIRGGAAEVLLGIIAAREARDG